MFENRGTTVLQNQVFQDCLSKAQKEVPSQHLSYRSLIFKLVKNFEAHGTCEGHRVTGFSPSGPSVTMRFADNVTRAQDPVGWSLSKSLLRRSQELGFSASSVRCILVKDLELHPYRFQIKHQLTKTDMEKKFSQVQWFSEKISTDEGFLNDVWLTDEAHFLLNGHVTPKA